MTTYENARPVRKSKGGPVLLLVVLLVVAAALGAGVTYLLTKPSEQAAVDRCTAQAVRTFPAEEKLKLSKLDACAGLSDQQLTDIAKALQDFFVSSVTRTSGADESGTLNGGITGEAK